MDVTPFCKVGPWSSSPGNFNNSRVHLETSSYLSKYNCYLICHIKKLSLALIWNTKISTNRF